jgi:hypothetical protein
VKTIHVWRERRASFGELVMQDSSPFRWLEERGPIMFFATTESASVATNGKFPRKRLVRCWHLGKTVKA